MVKELKRIEGYEKGTHSYQVYWNKRKEGLCYYFFDDSFKIIDFENGKAKAIFKYTVMNEYIEYKGIKYYARIDFKKWEIYFNIPGYSREKFSFKNSSHLDFFKT